MSPLDKLFAAKTTENGDLSWNTTGNIYLDIVFQTEYFGKHLSEAQIGDSDLDQLFAMFIRDPRFGLGRRDLGRVLMHQAGCTPDQIALAGRFDDIYHCLSEKEAADYFYQEIKKGNELAKKWAPRYSSKNLLTALVFAHAWHMTKQQYGKFIKCDTTENKLSRHRTEDIIFEHVPSLALLKYYRRFSNGEDTRVRFAKYLDDVRSGKKELHVSTTTVYDIYKNRAQIDADLFFDKIEKIALNCIPIVDTSGSMTVNDAMGKALSIGHYLAKCSTYAPNQCITFSSNPHLITLGQKPAAMYGMPSEFRAPKSQYLKEIASMYTGDCTNTDFGKVLDLLQGLETYPEYLVVLSDMEFDIGSRQSKIELQKLWQERGIKTKLVWWNFNARNTTVPELQEDGNIYLSGYNPTLLQFLQAGFDGKKFLAKLLSEYQKNISK